MSEEVEFDPDEPLAFGQVWRYTNAGLFGDAMVIVPGEYVRSFHFGSPFGELGIIDPELGGWSSLRDRLPAYWRRLA